MRVTLFKLIEVADDITVGGYEVESVEFPSRGLALMNLADETMAAFEDQEVEYDVKTGETYAVETLDDAEPDEERRTLHLTFEMRLPVPAESLR